MYGRGSFTDYYHKSNDVCDDPKHEESEPQVLNNSDLNKIKVFGIRDGKLFLFRIT